MKVQLGEDPLWSSLTLLLANSVPHRLRDWGPQFFTGFWHRPPMWTSWVTHSMVTGLHQTEERMSGGKLVFCILITEDYFNFFKGTSLKKILKKRKKKKGLLKWLSGKESICQCRRWGFSPQVGKIPWRRKQQPTPVLLPGKSQGQKSLVGYFLGVAKLESDTA